MYIYQRFKLWIWLILAIAGGTGAISKSKHGQSWEVVLNGAIAAVSLIVFVYLLYKMKAAKAAQQANKGHTQLVTLFTIAGALAAAAMIPYQLEAGLLDTITERSSLSQNAAVVLTVVQTALITMVISIIGLSLSKKVNLGAPLLNTWLRERSRPSISVKWISIAIAGSAIGTLLTAILEVYVFQPQLPETTVVEVSIWKTALLMFYGGIVEEVWLRLGLMTVIVWLISGAYRRRGASIPASLYWVAILCSAILFGLAHLPATEAAFGPLTSIMVVRALVLNGVLGVFFGYLYWKKGLEYAIISHMCADLMLQVVWYNVFQ